MNPDSDFETMILSTREDQRALREIQILIEQAEIKVVDILRRKDQLVIVYRRLKKPQTPS